MQAPAAAGLAVLAGTLVAAQAALLGVFARHINPVSGALWVHVGGVGFGLVAVAVAGSGFQVGGLQSYPWGLLAGVAGVGIVASIGAAVAPLGLGTTIVIVTATQLALGLGLDAVGIAGRIVPLSPARLVGVAMVIGGAVLVFGRTPPA